MQRLFAGAGALPPTLAQLYARRQSRIRAAPDAAVMPPEAQPSLFDF
ncbi:MAG: hypothetical protein WB816_12600 [Methylocystis sp.]|jgi:hypothetical protein